MNEENHEETELNIPQQVLGYQRNKNEVPLSRLLVFVERE